MGARDTYIHWAQEMFDQAGMLREIVKWDYELRNGVQLETIVDRALTIATSPPEGPVYLSLPREVLAETLPGFTYDAPSRHVAASPPAPDEAAVAAAARLLASAQNPVIVTADAGRDRAAVPALAQFAERFAIPVVEHRQRHLSLPADHPCHLGYNPASLIEGADAILVIDCDVPWIPSRQTPAPDCAVVHIGVDPLFSRYPVRGFTCDVAITGATRLVLPRLGAAMAPLMAEPGIAARRQRIAERREAMQAGWRKMRDEARAMQPISPVWVSACLAEARDPRSAIVNEYTLLPEHCPSTRVGSFFGSSPAAGLGWGAGAALGVKLAEPDRQVIAVLGDGSYLFANPVAVHHASTLHRLPVLVRRRQQRDVGRGAPRDPRHVPQGRRLAQQPPAVHRPRRTPGLRAGLRSVGRLRRARRGPRRTAGRPPTRPPRRQCRKAPGIAQRDLPGRRRGVIRRCAPLRNHPRRRRRSNAGSPRSWPPMLSATAG